MSDPHPYYGKLRPELQPKFPFFGHRTMSEVAETERLALLAAAGKITPYQMIQLRELTQKGRAGWPS